MQLLIYILIFPILWVISIVPFKVLYFFSDIISSFLYYIVGYRKKVVLYNLKMSFPEKTIEELELIRREFYRHFIDVFMEMIKSITISEKEVRKHFIFKNVELLNKYGDQGKSIILMGGHYANWEWMVSLNNLLTKHNAVAVYTSIGNKYFDRMMFKNRSKYGGQLVSAQEARRTYQKNSKNGILALNALVSDQSPQLHKTRYWTEFMGIKVPVHTGAEVLAKTLSQVVIFFEVEKVKRGYYACSFKLITENPNEHPNYEITDLFFREVERQIRKAPAYYFWTHKRFKHKDKFEEWQKLRNEYLNKSKRP